MGKQLSTHTYVRLTIFFRGRTSIVLVCLSQARGAAKLEGPNLGHMLEFPAPP